MMPLNWKLILPLWLLMPLNQQAKKRVTMLAGVIDPDYEGEIGLLFHNRYKDEYIWNTGGPLEYLLVLPCPVIKVKRKPQQTQSRQD